MLTPIIIREKLKRAIRSSVWGFLPRNSIPSKKRSDCQSSGGTCVSVWPFGFLFLLTWITLPFLSSWNNLQEENNYLILICGIFLLLPLLHKKQAGTLHLSWTDIWMVAIYIWIGLCSTILNTRVLSNEHAALLVACFLFYLIGRLLIETKSVLLYLSFVVGGTIQMAYAWLQYLQWIPSKHLLFGMTGSFYNPAYLAAYLGFSCLCVFPLTAYLLHRRWRIVALVVSFMGLAMLFTITVLQSRATWIALYGSLAWFSSSFIKRKTAFWMVGIIVLVLSLFPLYQMKRGSADGRLLIWNVGWTMFKEKPVCGGGSQSFAARYFPTQAQYLSTHPQSRLAGISAPNIHTFNEPLRILCEYGLIGVLLFLGLVISVSYKQWDCFRLSLLLYFFLFSLFSNPCEVSILPLSGVLLFGILSSKRKVVSSVHPFCWKTLFVPIAIVIGGFALAKYHRTSQIVLSLREHSALNRYESFDGYRKEGWFHRNFLLIYSKQLYKNQKYGNAVTYLEQLSRLSPVADVYMDLGKCYQHLRMYKNAEECFTLVLQARPEYVLPYYELFRLYVECGDRGQAWRIGRKILSKDFHQDSSMLDEARRNVRLYLDSLDSDNPLDIYNRKTQDNKIIPFKCE